MGDGLFAPWHIIVLVIVLVLLFGSTRLPRAARSLGQSMHIFKQSVSGLSSDNDANDNASGFTATGATTPPPAVAPPAQPLQDTRDPAHEQLQDLQRQVAELQRQSAAGNAGQPSQPI